MLPATEEEAGAGPWPGCCPAEWWTRSTWATRATASGKALPHWGHLSPPAAGACWWYSSACRMSSETVANRAPQLEHDSGRSRTIRRSAVLCVVAGRTPQGERRPWGSEGRRRVLRLSRALRWTCVVPGGGGGKDGGSGREAGDWDRMRRGRRTNSALHSVKEKKRRRWKERGWGREH